MFMLYGESERNWLETSANIFDFSEEDIYETRNYSDDLSGYNLKIKSKEKWIKIHEISTAKLWELTFIVWH